MNNDFLLKENLMKKNLLWELRYSLPTVRLLENVNAAFFQLPDGQTLVLKNRHGGSLNKSDSVTFDNYNATEEEIHSLSRKTVEIKFSGFNKRGQNAILDYIAAVHREQMKLVLEGKSSDKKESREKEVEDLLFKGLFFREQSPEEFLQQAIKLGSPFITSHKPGSGKTALIADLAKSIPSLFSTLSVLSGDAKGSNKEQEDLSSSNVSTSSSLYLDCNMLAELKNGQVKFIKSREGVKNISPEMEFLVLTDLNQLKFYPKGFFKGKNVLIAK